MPPHLRYDLYDEDSAWSAVGQPIALRMISAYLEYLHTDFQMQRLLRRQTQMAVPALLENSMKLLSTVLVFNKQRDQEYDIRRHFPTLVLFYCLPSAGVLALELRRCTLENVPLPSTVSRADIIRNLSVLISCLEWAILPGDGNHKLCSELNKMLALVLDEVLNYQPPANNESQGEGGNAGVVGAGGGAGGTSGFFDMPLIDGMEPIPTESEDFLNWLDNANWNNTVRTISVLSEVAERNPCSWRGVDRADRGTVSLLRYILRAGRHGIGVKRKHTRSKLPSIMDAVDMACSSWTRPSSTYEEVNDYTFCYLGITSKRTPVFILPPRMFHSATSSTRRCALASSYHSQATYPLVLRMYSHCPETPLPRRRIRRRSSIERLLVHVLLRLLLLA